MLTFFRRIRKGLLGTGATRKPASPAGRYLVYAVGEILLVMIGILLALQVNNWNEWRKDRIKEKEVLEDILTNLNRNNDLIQNGLDQISLYNESSDIIISAINNKQPYSDTLDQHFFTATRTGGLLFPVSLEGYESYKNAGFEIISSKNVKDRILQLFEVSYVTLKARAEWAMQTSLLNPNLLSHFRVLSGEKWRPIDYEELLNDSWYYSYLNITMDNLRNHLKEHVIICLQQNQEVIDLIKEELRTFETN